MIGLSLGLTLAPSRVSVAVDAVLQAIRDAIAASTEPLSATPWIRL